MGTMLDWSPNTTAPAEALIREARRRQRRRRVAILLLVVIAAGTAWYGARARGGDRHNATSRPPAVPSPTGPPTTSTLPIPRTVDTALLLWGPGPSFVENLGTQRVSSRLPILGDIGYGDFQPLASVIGDRVVFVGNGVSVVGGNMSGQPHRLARTSFFAPAASAGKIWLVTPRRQGSLVRLTSLSDGVPGSPIRLPPGTALVRGTDAGLLLEAYRKDGAPLELWRPGRAPTVLPGTMWADGFSANRRLVAYGTDCRVLSPTASYEPDACRTLRVLNVVTGRGESYESPRGTVGWVPFGFNLVDAITRSGTDLAAEAAILPRHADRGRLYILSLNQPRRQPTPVPGSAGSVRSRVAWSIRGGWLLYQGPHGRLSAYQPRTSRVLTSTTPCCQYTVMAAAPTQR